jgi:uncharacterized protein (TIGR00369 family)
VIEEQRTGYVRLSLPYDESLGNPGTGFLQGGVVATLVDHAGSATLRTTLDDPGGTPHATTELNVSYVRPATGDLTAEGSVVRTGGSTGVVRVDVSSAEDDETVAVGRVSLHIDR